MVTLTDWFEITTDFQFKSLVGSISFGIIILWTIIFQVLISNKVRNSNVKSDAFRSFRLLYVAVAFVTASYFADHLGNFFSGKILHSNFSIALSVIGYTIAISALNLFLLRIINFRTSIKRFIKVLAFIEAGLLSIVSVLYLVASFIDLPEVILDNTIIIMGIIVVIAVVFTIISMIVEGNQTANKMVKLRLRMATIGTIGILLDGISNIIHIVLSSFGISDELFYRYTMPILSVLFYFTFMISYYYSLFPPMWLQRTTGVLPPSFIELMNKQAELKKVEGVTN
ncbi:MAG: hypothetical protein EAX90_09630 [Candidatus Heimdallarchaeota archaeon]|nr:hypothetical protein [Candidatus Heimdallarchaeota archaeon]